MNNNLVQVITSNASAIVLLYIIILNFHKKYESERKEHKVFLRMLLINIFQCFFESVSIIIDGKMFPLAVPISTVINASLYMGNILFAYLWSSYAYIKICNTTRKKMMWRKFESLPAIVILVMAFLNIFIPVFFEVSPENVYTRTNLFIVPYIATYYYLLMGVCRVFMYRKVMGAYAFLPVATFLLPVSGGSVAQFFIEGISVLWLGAAIGLASAYISQLDERSAIDELSGTFSRHYLNRYLAYVSAKKREAESIVGIMLDINDFKSINDNFGHISGDDAIITVGKLLKSVAPSDAVVFRYAGDEFVIIMNYTSDEDVNEFIEKINLKSGEANSSSNTDYSISFAAGYAVYAQNDTPIDFLRKMDEAMYINKSEIKKEIYG